MTKPHKTALVTGGNRGIGLAIVAGLAKQGNIQVLMGSRVLEEGRAAASMIAGHVIPVALDLSERNLMKRQVADIQDHYGPIHILINNAGILEEGNLLEVSEAAFTKSLRVNFEAPFDLIRLIVPGMIQENYGRIVNLSSGWGSFNEGLDGPAAYSISKAALNALTLSLSHALPATIKVNSMCPGWVRTRMGGEGAVRSPEKGADTAIWLATLPENGPSGGFFRDRKPIQW